MPTVATGTPFGIWTIERRASMPSQRAAFQGDADNGKGRVGGDDAGQMGGQTRCRDDYLYAFFSGAFGMVCRFFGMAMGGSDIKHEVHAHFLQKVEAVLHKRHVALASKKNKDRCFLHASLLFLSCIARLPPRGATISLAFRAIDEEMITDYIMIEIWRGGRRMPIYEYECLDCGKKFEIFQKMSEEPLKECKVCRAVSTGLFPGALFS